MESSQQKLTMDENASVPVVANDGDTTASSPSMQTETSAHTNSDPHNDIAVALLEQATASAHPSPRLPPAQADGMNSAASTTATAADPSSSSSPPTSARQQRPISASTGRSRSKLPRVALHLQQAAEYASKIDAGMEEKHGGEEPISQPMTDGNAVASEATLTTSQEDGSSNEATMSPVAVDTSPNGSADEQLSAAAVHNSPAEQAAADADSSSQGLRNDSEPTPATVESQSNARQIASESAFLTGVDGADTRTPAPIPASAIPSAVASPALSSMDPSSTSRPASGRRIRPSRAAEKREEERMQIDLLSALTHAPLSLQQQSSGASMSNNNTGETSEQQLDPIPFPSARPGHGSYHVPFGQPFSFEDIERLKVEFMDRLKKERELAKLAESKEQEDEEERQMDETERLLAVESAKFLASIQARQQQFESEFVRLQPRIMTAIHKQTYISRREEQVAMWKEALTMQKELEEQRAAAAERRRERLRAKALMEKQRKEEEQKLAAWSAEQEALARDQADKALREAILARNRAEHKRRLAKFARLDEQARKEAEAEAREEAAYAAGQRYMRQKVQLFHESIKTDLLGGMEFKEVLAAGLEEDDSNEDPWAAVNREEEEAAMKKLEEEAEEEEEEAEPPKPLTPPQQKGHRRQSSRLTGTIGKRASMMVGRRMSAFMGNGPPPFPRGSFSTTKSSPKNQTEDGDGDGGQQTTGGFKVTVETPDGKQREGTPARKDGSNDLDRVDGGADMDADPPPPLHARPKRKFISPAVVTLRKRLMEYPRLIAAMRKHWYIALSGVPDPMLSKERFVEYHLRFWRSVTSSSSESSFDAIPDRSAGSAYLNHPAVRFAMMDWTRRCSVREERTVPLVWPTETETGMPSPASSPTAAAASGSPAIPTPANPLIQVSPAAPTTTPVVGPSPLSSAAKTLQPPPAAPSTSLAPPGASPVRRPSATGTSLLSPPSRPSGPALSAPTPTTPTQRYTHDELLGVSQDDFNAFLFENLDACTLTCDPEDYVLLLDAVYECITMPERVPIGFNVQPQQPQQPQRLVLRAVNSVRSVSVKSDHLQLPAFLLDSEGMDYQLFKAEQKRIKDEAEKAKQAALEAAAAKKKEATEAAAAGSGSEQTTASKKKKKRKPKPIKPKPPANDAASILERQKARFTSLATQPIVRLTEEELVEREQLFLTLSAYPALPAQPMPGSRAPTSTTSMQDSLRPLLLREWVLIRDRLPDARTRKRFLAVKWSMLTLLLAEYQGISYRRAKAGIGPGGTIIGGLDMMWHGKDGQKQHQHSSGENASTLDSTPSSSPLLLARLRAQNEALGLSPGGRDGSIGPLGGLAPGEGIFAKNWRTPQDLMTSLSDLDLNHLSPSWQRLEANVETSCLLALSFVHSKAVRMFGVQPPPDPLDVQMDEDKEWSDAATEYDTDEEDKLEGLKRKTEWSSDEDGEYIPSTDSDLSSTTEEESEEESESSSEEEESNGEDSAGWYSPDEVDEEGTAADTEGGGEARAKSGGKRRRSKSKRASSKKATAALAPGGGGGAVAAGTKSAKKKKRRSTQSKLLTVEGDEANTDKTRRKSINKNKRRRSTSIPPQTKKPTQPNKASSKRRKSKSNSTKKKSSKKGEQTDGTAADDDGGEESSDGEYKPPSSARVYTAEERAAILEQHRLAQMNRIAGNMELVASRAQTPEATRSRPASGPRMTTSGSNSRAGSAPKLRPDGTRMSAEEIAAVEEAQLAELMDELGLAPKQPVEEEKPKQEEPPTEPEPEPEPSTHDEDESARNTASRDAILGDIEFAKLSASFRPSIAAEKEKEELARRIRQKQKKLLATSGSEMETDMDTDADSSMSEQIPSKLMHERTRNHRRRSKMALAKHRRATAAADSDADGGASVEIPSKNVRPSSAMRMLAPVEEQQVAQELVKALAVTGLDVQRECELLMMLVEPTMQETEALTAEELQDPESEALKATAMVPIPRPTPEDAAAAGRAQVASSAAAAQTSSAASSATFNPEVFAPLFAALADASPAPAATPPAAPSPTASDAGEGKTATGENGARASGSDGRDMLVQVIVDSGHLNETDLLRLLTHQKCGRMTVEDARGLIQKTKESRSRPASQQRMRARSRSRSQSRSRPQSGANMNVKRKDGATTPTASVTEGDGAAPSDATEKPSEEAVERPRSGLGNKRATLIDVLLTLVENKHARTPDRSHATTPGSGSGSPSASRSRAASAGSQPGSISSSAGEASPLEHHRPSLAIQQDQWLEIMERVEQSLEQASTPITERSPSPSPSASPSRSRAVSQSGDGNTTKLKPKPKAKPNAQAQAQPQSQSEPRGQATRPMRPRPSINGGTAVAALLVHLQKRGVAVDDLRRKVGVTKKQMKQMKRAHQRQISAEIQMDVDDDDDDAESDSTPTRQASKKKPSGIASNKKKPNARGAASKKGMEKGASHKGKQRPTRKAGKGDGTSGSSSALVTPVESGIEGGVSASPEPSDASIHGDAAADPFKPTHTRQFSAPLSLQSYIPNSATSPFRVILHQRSQSAQLQGRLSTQIGRDIDDVEMHEALHAQVVALTDALVAVHASRAVLDSRGGTLDEDALRRHTQLEMQIERELAHLSPAARDEVLSRVSTRVQSAVRSHRETEMVRGTPIAESPAAQRSISPNLFNHDMPSIDVALTDRSGVRGSKRGTNASVRSDRSFIAPSGSQSEPISPRHDRHATMLSSMNNNIMDDALQMLVGQGAIVNLDAMADHDDEPVLKSFEELFGADGSVMEEDGLILDGASHRTSGSLRYSSSDRLSPAYSNRLSPASSARLSGGSVTLSSPRSAALPSPRALGIPATVSPINISPHAGTPLSAPRSRAASSHAGSTGRKDASDGMAHATDSGNVEDAPAVPSAISAFQARISAELEKAGLMHTDQESQEESSAERDGASHGDPQQKKLTKREQEAAALRRRLRYRPARPLSAQSGADAVQRALNSVQQARKKLDEQLHTENVRATIQQFKKQHQHMYDAAHEEEGDEKRQAEQEARQQQYYYLRRQTLHARAQQLRRMEHNLLLRNRGARVLVHGAGKERKKRVAFLRTPWSAQGEQSSTHFFGDAKSNLEWLPRGAVYDVFSAEEGHVGIGMMMQDQEMTEAANEKEEEYLENDGIVPRASPRLSDTFYPLSRDAHQHAVVATRSRHINQEISVPSTIERASRHRSQRMMVSRIIRSNDGGRHGKKYVMVEVDDIWGLTAQKHSLPQQRQKIVDWSEEVVRKEAEEKAQAQRDAHLNALQRQLNAAALDDSVYDHDVGSTTFLTHTTYAEQVAVTQKFHTDESNESPVESPSPSPSPPAPITLPDMFDELQRSSHPAVDVQTRGSLEAAAAKASRQHGEAEEVKEEEEEKERIDTARAVEKDLTYIRADSTDKDVDTTTHQALPVEGLAEARKSLELDSNWLHEQTERKAEQEKPVDGEKESSAIPDATEGSAEEAMTMEDTDATSATQSSLSPILRSSSSVPLLRSSLLKTPLHPKVTSVALPSAGAGAPSAVGRPTVLQPLGALTVPRKRSSFNDTQTEKDPMLVQMEERARMEAEFQQIQHQHGRNRNSARLSDIRNDAGPKRLTKHSLTSSLQPLSHSSSVSSFTSFASPPRTFVINSPTSDSDLRPSSVPHGRGSLGKHQLPAINRRDVDQSDGLPSAGSAFLTEAPITGFDSDEDGAMFEEKEWQEPTQQRRSSPSSSPSQDQRNRTRKRSTSATSLNSTSPGPRKVATSTSAFSLRTPMHLPRSQAFVAAGVEQRKVEAMAMLAATTPNKIKLGPMMPQNTNNAASSPSSASLARSSSAPFIVTATSKFVSLATPSYKTVLAPAHVVHAQLKRNSSEKTMQGTSK